MNGHIQSTRKLGLAALSLCIAAIASTGEAQGIADSFEQLRVLVKPGDTVSVTDTAGREVTGTITALSSSSGTLLFFVESDGAGDAAGFVAAYGALGMGIGVGVDALITRRRVI